jgi:hypothetical protein
MSYLIKTATPEAIEAYKAGKGSIASLARHHGLKYLLLHGRTKLGKQPRKAQKPHYMKLDPVFLIFPNSTLLLYPRSKSTQAISCTNEQRPCTNITTGSSKGDALWLARPCLL